MTDTYEQNNHYTCNGCIYEDCYIGICNDCGNWQRDALRRLSDVVKVHFGDWILYRLK